LVLAIRALFIGQTSFEPVLFAELYVWLFGTVAFVIVVLRTLRVTGGKHMLVLFVAALAGAVLFVQIAPTIGEPNYCGRIGDYPSVIDLTMPPKIFRCTSVPFEVAGWFAGWGVALWLLTWRDNPR
jgi:hypothetical protein